MDWIYWLAIIPVLSVLVFVHEFGHFVAALWAKVKIEEAGVGYPPRLFAVRWRDIDWSINLIPIGGFVRMRGEEDPSADNSLASKPPWKRAVVLVSGVAMNVLLAVLLYAAIYAVGEPIPVGPVVVTDLIPGAPAAVAGLQVDDVILRLDDHEVLNTTDLAAYTDVHRGQPVLVTVRRGDEIVQMTVTPRVSAPAGQGAMGIGIRMSEITETRMISHPIWEAMAMGAQHTLDVLQFMLDGLRGMVMGTVAPAAAGPVGIAQATSEVARRSGLLGLVDLTALLSLNFALINLIPFPGLDGGRLIFVLLEALRRGKRIDPEKEAIVHFAGLVLMMAFVAFVSIFDVLRIIRGESLLF
ncbi:MAG: site-2 protease family protein [Chloroflexi bacterium]|nr:site-2 protease family protein [Chloroflexota bacterium]MBU1746097.1 site-2 protease family protein [Chloroflexota bacterium]